MSKVDLEALANDLAPRSRWITPGVYVGVSTSAGFVEVFVNGRVEAKGGLDWEVIDIIRRHLDPPVARPELRERCAKAALDAAWYDADGHGWVDPEKLPEGDSIEDWECEAIHWDYALDYWRGNGRRIADAVIAEMLPSREAIRAEIAEVGYEVKVATGWPSESDWKAVHGERYVDIDAAADAVLRLIAGGDE